MFNIDFLDLPPLTSAAGTVHLPGSKSISNRVLLMAAMSTGETVVRDLLESDDTQVMLTALRQLGCSVVELGDSVVVAGLGGHLKNDQLQLFMGNAGTAMRPLTAALALLGASVTLSGVPRMHERPIGDLVDALRQLGCQIEYLGTTGFPPLQLRPGVMRLNAPIEVRGDVSSQFLTALLMALPLVAEQDIHIDVIGELISKPYISITLNLLKRFGIQIRQNGWHRFTVPAGSKYISPGEIYVEADASSASYFIALGAIASRTTGTNDLKISGIGEQSIQGDIRFIEAVRAMGAHVDSSPNALVVRRGQWPLKAIDLDCNHIPDAAMTLAIMALYADGCSTLRNIASWRVKETDRISAMACELQKLGAVVEEGIDYLRITPPAEPADWRAATIHTYDDHRMAMCFALAAFNPAALPVRILDPKCVAKTYPDYFENLFSVTQTDNGCIPVICIDGPTASGKGTLAAKVAQKLGYHYLDSGALYRLTALAAQQAGVELDDAHGAAAVAQTLKASFAGDQVFLDGVDVSAAIRSEAAGMAASRVSVHPAVRKALVALQHGFRTLPGLVADGRDMGSVIFPDSNLKIYLTASALHRAERRHKQLILKENTSTLELVLQDLEARDARDMSRLNAPLKPAERALLLDNSDLSIEKSVDQVIGWWQATRPF